MRGSRPKTNPAPRRSSATKKKPPSRGRLDLDALMDSSPPFPRPSRSSVSRWARSVTKQSGEALISKEKSGVHELRLVCLLGEFRLRIGFAAVVCEAEDDRHEEQSRDRCKEQTADHRTT